MLTPKERARLRALGNRLAISATLGKEAPDEAFLDAVDKALTAHGLVKIRFLDTALPIMEEGPKIAFALKAEWVGKTGKTCLIYRESGNPKALNLKRMGI